MHLAICDDSSEIVEQIESYIENIKDIRIDYEVFFSGEELHRYIQNVNITFDIYVLDIEMDKLSGIELARIIRTKHPYALIIFLTSYPKYVYDVFDVITFDFILKPLTYTKFVSVIDKAAKYLHSAKVNFIFRYRKNTYSVPCRSIMYIEKHGRKAYIHRRDGNVDQCNMTINEIWEQLSTKRFAQIHTSCIVNLEAISEIVRDQIILEDNSTLYIARNHKQEVKLRHLEFLKE